MKSAVRREGHGVPLPSLCSTWSSRTRTTVTKLSGQFATPTYREDEGFGVSGTACLISIPRAFQPTFRMANIMELLAHADC